MWSFKAAIVILLASLAGIEAAHLNYHAQSEQSERLNCAKPQIFDRNF
jgi:hypothetical protein